MGIDFFDTGVHYGQAETMLGTAKRRYGDSISVATKIGLDHASYRNFSIPFLESQLKQCLARLGPEPIDLLQLNKPPPSEFATDTLDLFIKDLKQRGVIKNFGIVAGTAESAEFFLQNLDYLDSIQIFFNLLHPEARTALELASSRGIHTIVRSPLNSGLLSGYYTESTKFRDNDERGKFFQGSIYLKRLAAIRKIQSDLGISNDSLIEFSLSYILSHPTVDIVIPGASTTDQLRRYLNPNIIEASWSPDRLFSIDQVVQNHYGAIRAEALGV